MKKTYLILIICLISIPVHSQELINKLDWLEGSWVTEKWGGVMEEYWSAPSGNTIIGMYRFTVNDTVNFTEHFMIIEEEGNLILKLKHFDKNFHGWEEKNKYVEFPFIEMKNNYVKFDGIVYELVNKDTLKAYVNLDRESEGKIEEFVYNRIK